MYMKAASVASHRDLREHKEHVTLSRRAFECIQYYVQDRYFWVVRGASLGSERIKTGLCGVEEKNMSL